MRRIKSHVGRYIYNWLRVLPTHMNVSPTEWSIESWLMLGTVLLGVWVIGYGVQQDAVGLSWVGVAFILLSLFLWVGRPSAYE